MDAIPLYVPITFILTTFISVAFLVKAARGSKLLLITLSCWLALQYILGQTGFYLKTDTVPPRFMLLVFPPLLAIVVLFATRNGRNFLSRLDPWMLTLLHVVRVPVELVLYGLLIYKAVPQSMTFEGRNFDMVSGLTAPIVYYLYFVKHSIGKNVLLVWNFLCLALLINVVATAVLSLPLPFQKIDFDQPNIAVLYSPYVWLPCCVVPIVLLSHLVMIRSLLVSEKKHLAL